VPKPVEEKAEELSEEDWGAAFDLEAAAANVEETAPEATHDAEVKTDKASDEADWGRRLILKWLKLLKK